MKSVFVLPGSGQAMVEQMFISHDGRIKYNLTSELNLADLVVFTSGSDVSPSIYNRHTHTLTSCNKERDEKEAFIYEQGQELGIPMVGICRGAQFLNVMNGGELYQDVNNHALGGDVHKAYVISSMLEIDVTSTHHQQMVPNYKDCIVLMVSNETTEYAEASKLDCHKSVWRSKYKVNSITNPAHGRDIEALFYPETECICFQPHPEYGHKPTYETFFFMLDNNIWNEEVK